MKTPILGQSYVARSVNASDSRMVNLFPEVVPQGGKEPAFLNRAPGMELLATVGSGPVRGMAPMGTWLYVVSGESLYRMNTGWGHQFLGTVSGTGPVSMASNGNQMFIACNGPSYIYDSRNSTFNQITDEDFPGAVTVTFLDGYFVFNEPDSQKIWITSLYDGFKIDALEFASAEGAPDNVVGVMTNFRELWVFGTDSTEVWYDSGATDFPLQRIQGAFNEIGCASPYTIAKMNNTIFWLGQDARGRGIIYQANGYIGQRVSTHAVEWQIQQYPTISDAIAYTYQQDGHQFYVLTFPSANATWVYDAAAQAWHERGAWTGTAFTRHRSNCQASFGNEIAVGDFENGNIYALRLDVYNDNGAAQKWLRSWRALASGQNNLNRTAQHSLQLDCESGVGTDAVAKQLLDAENNNNLITEDGLYLEAVPATPAADSLVYLRWSDDGGHTWNDPRSALMGGPSETGKRVYWRRLGMTMKLRDRVYEVSGTDAVKIAIMGAEMQMSPTNA